MTRWLVTGGTGLLGANALAEISRDTDAVGVARRPPMSANAQKFLAVDLASRKDRDGVVARSGADRILHAAAIATIEGCEADPEGAYELNVLAAEDLALQARKEGARFVFISTDAVFDGVAGSYTEDDPTNPISEYGKGKVEAEQRVLDVNPDALVARVNFYGWSPNGVRSLAEFFYNRLSKGEAVGGFTDVSVSTTYVGHLVAAIRELDAITASGIFHVVTSQGTSKYEFGRELAKTFGFASDLVKPVLSSEVLAARRGSNLILQTNRLRKALGHELPTSAEGLRDLRADREAGRPALLDMAYRAEETHGV